MLSSGEAPEAVIKTAEAMLGLRIECTWGKSTEALGAPPMVETATFGGTKALSIPVVVTGQELVNIPLTVEVGGAQVEIAGVVVRGAVFVERELLLCGQSVEIQIPPAEICL